MYKRYDILQLSEIEEKYAQFQRGHKQKYVDR